LNSYDYDGRTALHLAASEGHIDVVQYLIAHGANINLTDARGNKPLDDAIREKRHEIVEFLTHLLY